MISSKPPRKKKTIQSITHAVVKKTNRAIHLGTKGSNVSNVSKTQTANFSHHNLGQGGIATSTFLNRQKNALDYNPNQNYGDDIFENSLLSTLHADKKGVDPHDEKAVGELVCQILNQLSVDPRSIGGTNINSDKNNSATNNLLLQENTSSPMTPQKTFKSTNNGSSTKLMNECLICMQVGKFIIEGSTKYNFSKKKAKNKLRFICIIRSTNRPLLMTVDDQEETDEKNDVEEDLDVDDNDGYDTMYTEYNMPSQNRKNESELISNQTFERKNASASILTKRNKFVVASTDEDEISSFPHLLCLALHSDGTSPDIRKIISLSQLVSITAPRETTTTPSNAHGVSYPNTQGNIRLRFRSGDIIEINPNLRHSSENNNVPLNPNETKDDMRKERLLWSLLQIQSILCASVVERHVAKFRKSQALLLPPLSFPHKDRAELQYLSTVNGFLSDSPTLVALLERQRMSGTQRKIHQHGSVGDDNGMDPANGGNDVNGRGNGANGDKTNQGINMDGMAYDMMMGNYSRFNLFQNPEEEKDAADILNASAWKPANFSSMSQNGKSKKKKKNSTPLKDNLSKTNDNQDFDASTTSDALTLLLEKRMRDLEAETCRRLIAWEDEKNNMGNNILTTSPNMPKRVDVLSLSSLISTLDSLDSELKSMEEWLEKRAAAIKPLTDDCREIEEENRQLEQHCRSYDILGSEMNRLLNGLHLPDHLNQVLQDPGTVLPFVQTMMNSENKDVYRHSPIDTNEEGVDLIYEAGLKLKEVLDRAHTDGGIHLRAIYEHVELLNETKESYCEALSMITLRVMETLATDIVDQLGPLNKDTDSHTVIVKKLKDTQRKFQTSFLVYKRLLEVIALLKPELLEPIRAGYAELVAEGILGKKRMKAYFHSLPVKSCTGIVSVSLELKDYSPATLKAGNTGIAGIAQGIEMKPTDSKDIKMALEEVLPLINREAYFTAVMFSIGEKKLDSSKKKRNFEAVKKSVDHSTAWFKYYITRVLGTGADTINGQVMNGDPMLSLVASLHLAEAMETYFDKEKKGNEHSLALAYVRFTIMSLKKGVEKQWVSWVEKEIRWIRTSAGVPLSGKRAGVFNSFLNFPSYLDHILMCFRAGKESSKYVPKLTKFKTISYYLQKMAGALFASLDECSTRETTDQQYAASVMRMENTYFFTQTIKNRESEFSALFAKQITAAQSICKHSMDAYLGWMIKREFKQLHSLFSSISSIRKEVGDADVPIHVPRATFERTMLKESNREVMKEKISAIYSRMEKHLSEAGRLLPVAWKALVKVLYEWFGRWEKLSTECYKFVLNPSAIDMVKIAKAAGGSSSRKSNHVGMKVTQRLDESDPEAKKYSTNFQNSRHVYQA